MLSALSEALKRVRGARNQGEVATTLGIHKNTYALYEHGDRLPDVEFLVAFSTVFEADFAELLGLRLQESERADVRAAAADLARNTTIHRGLERRHPGAGVAYPFGKLDVERLRVAIQAVDAVLSARKIDADAAEWARLIIEAYEGQVVPLKRAIKAVD